MFKASWSSAVVVAAALFAAGCQSDGSGSRSSSNMRASQAGDVALDGVVRIVRVDTAPDGRVTYVLENISGRLQEDLSYRIYDTFEGQSSENIVVGTDTEVAGSGDLVLLKGDTAKELVAENPRKGKQVLSTYIEVQQTPPVAAVAREPGRPGTGTLFVNRTLECVAMASEDEIRDGKLWIEVENVSSRPVTSIEARAVFRDPHSGDATSSVESPWTSVKDMQPGGRSRVNFDISKCGRVAHLVLLIKIRQQSF